MNRPARLLMLLIATLYATESRAQSDIHDYISINLPPLIGTTLELGYEHNRSSHWSYDASLGFTVNSPLQGSTLVGSCIDYERKSGAFLKLGVRYGTRKSYDRYTPYLGAVMVNALCIERATVEDCIYPQIPIPTYTENKSSYALGVAGVIGVASPSDRIFSWDIGIQMGDAVVNNTIGYYESYIPGMGVYTLGVRVQGILRLKYAIR